MFQVGSFNLMMFVTVVAGIVVAAYIVKKPLKDFAE